MLRPSVRRMDRRRTDPKDSARTAIRERLLEKRAPSDSCASTGTSWSDLARAPASRRPGETPTPATPPAHVRVSAYRLFQPTNPGPRVAAILLPPFPPTRACRPGPDAVRARVVLFHAGLFAEGAAKERRMCVRRIVAGGRPLPWFPAKFAWSAPGLSRSIRTKALTQYVHKVWQDRSTGLPQNSVPGRRADARRLSVDRNPGRASCASMASASRSSTRSNTPALAAHTKRQRTARRSPRATLWVGTPRLAA